MHVNVTCHAVLTPGGGAVLVLCSSRLLFLLSSSLTGSLTRTPWYGLGLASADGGAREARNNERQTEREREIGVHKLIQLQLSWGSLCNGHDEVTVLMNGGSVGSLRFVSSDTPKTDTEEFDIRQNSTKKKRKLTLQYCSKCFTS